MLSLPCLFTLNWVLLYRFRRVSITRPLQSPFMILKNNILRLTRSKAFEKSTKHTKRDWPKSSCLSIKPCMKILSDVLLPVIKPPLNLSIFPMASLAKDRNWITRNMMNQFRYRNSNYSVSCRFDSSQIIFEWSAILHHGKTTLCHRK